MIRFRYYSGWRTVSENLTGSQEKVIVGYFKLEKVMENTNKALREKSGISVCSGKIFYLYSKIPLKIVKKHLCLRQSENVRFYNNCSKGNICITLFIH